MVQAGDAEGLQDMVAPSPAGEQNEADAICGRRGRAATWGSQACLPKAYICHFPATEEVYKVALTLGSAALHSDSSQLLQGLWGQSLLSIVEALGSAGKGFSLVGQSCTSAQHRSEVSAFLSCLSVTALS